MIRYVFAQAGHPAGSSASRPNCQVAVTLSIANHHASLPITDRLCLPRAWADNAPAPQQGACSPDTSCCTASPTPSCRPPSAFGRASVVECPTPRAPLTIFSAQARPYGVAGGLRQFLSLDRRMPTCQLSPGSDMPSNTLGSAMGRSAPPSFRGRHGRTCFDTRRGGQLPARVTLSQPSAVGRNTPATGAPQ
jgi:hypothetical protein